MFKMFNNRKGFSLVELIVVIAILGVISAIAIPAVLNTLSDSKVKADVATAQAIVKSINLAIVSANSDTADTNNIDKIETADDIDKELPANLLAELARSFPAISDSTLKTQSSNTAFQVVISSVTPDFAGIVSFTANGNKHEIDQTGKDKITKVGA